MKLTPWPGNMAIGPKIKQLQLQCLTNEIKLFVNLASEFDQYDQMLLEVSASFHGHEIKKTVTCQSESVKLNGRLKRIQIINWELQKGKAVNHLGDDH